MRPSNKKIAMGVGIAVALLLLTPYLGINLLSIWHEEPLPQQQEVTKQPPRALPRRERQASQDPPSELSEIEKMLKQ